jgi:Leucine-rich repeat (LRR) protein
MNPIALFLIPALALAVASAAPQEHCGFNGEDNLSCTLRTLQSDLHEDFDVGRARSISIKCGDGNGQFFSESHLKSEHFGNLPFLEELSIESCKMRRIPARAFAGLTNLRRLNLQSHNAEWSSVVMEVVRHAFDNMNQLEELNLAQNNLWSLPSGVFCSMPSLKAANLSGNHLLDVTDVGLSADAGCLANVAHLDLSENEITALRSGDLAQVEGKLKSLDLSHNRVAILGDEALSGLDSLLELNLGGNQLSALPPTVFNKSSSMQKLFLQNNTLTLLPAGIFGGLDGLVLLNLSHNAISSHLLSEETFNGLESLQMLDLSHNHMTKIQTSTFKTLVQLQVLYLQNNKIHTLAAGSFVRQAQLKMLSLSFNRLENITSDILVGLSDLTSLSLDNNGIKEVDIVGTPMLTDLALNKNQLRKVPSFIKSSTVLRTLDLGDNHISEIGDDEFSGLPNLYGLRLASNGLKHVSNGTFSDATNVHILNLAHNQIESMEVGAFSQLKELRVLRLDNNELEDINGLVSHLGKLEWFKVSGNNLQWFDYAFIPSSLEWLDIASNAIAELGNFYNLDNFGVKTLRAEGNKLKRLSPDSFPASLENIHISDNEIADVEPFTFERQRDLKTVDLSDNYLQTLYKDALRVKTPKGELTLH